MSTAPAISVVVPVFNGEATLARCLDSLRGQQGVRFEVIVVDDRSTDGSASIAERSGHRVLRLPRQGGPGRARNAGAAVARAPLLAFTDADCVLPPGWLSRIVAALADPAVGAVAGGYDFAASTGFVSRFSLLELRWRRRAMVADVDTASGANLAVRKALFEAVGGFPADLDYASTEDLVLTLRLSRRAPLRWLPHNGVGHHFREDVPTYLRQQFNFARPTPAVYAAHRALLTAHSHHPRSGFVAIPGAALLTLGAVCVPAPPVAVAAAGAGLLLMLGPELPFLRWLAGQASPGFAARAAGLIVLRDLAWLGGVARGVAELPSALRRAEAA